jgi:hypothetical protein
MVTFIGDQTRRPVVAIRGENSGRRYIRKPKLTWKDKALAATNGSQFGAIIRCALGLDAGLTTGPRFVGNASVTSDGFVMCNFIDKNGQFRHSAFVGSKDDLTRNFRGLSDHLKLNDKDRAAFRKVLASWISQDWSV